MNERTLGRTGLVVSEISFGGIPIQRSSQENTNQVVDKLEAYGMNYLDTARGYTVSEEYLGNALRGRREKFILATKSMARSYDAMKADIAISCRNLQTDYIDVYQIHNLPLSDFDQVFGEEGAYRALREAKELGIIGHIGATAHNLDALRCLVEAHSHQIETVMFPYNIVETHGHEVLALAREKGIGTIAMKPLAGGNLEDWSLALRFIHQSGVIDVIIPGMGSTEEVERNAAVSLTPLTPQEEDACRRIREQLGTRFCRRCNYCAPCTVGIPIPSQFLMLGYANRYDLKDWAVSRYEAMPHHAGECIGCGQCESRCPYSLPIREMLREAAAYFGK